MEHARKQVAQAHQRQPAGNHLHLRRDESDNLAIKGVAHRHRESGNHIVTLPTEHKAVLDSAKQLEKEGFRVTYCGCGPMGWWTSRN